MSQFLVNHDNYADVNDSLTRAVANMGDVLAELNQSLATTNQATHGQAVGLWQEQQQRWTASYDDMTVRLNAGAKASHNAGQIMRDGDQQGARIMQ